MRKFFSALLCAALLVSLITINTSAESVKYSSPSNAYRGTIYHRSLTSVNLTGDERDDVIAVALSQLYYTEGDSEKDFHGLNVSKNGNFTEYCYNYGALDQDGNGTREYGYPWCAAFVTFCLRRAEISKAVAPSHVNCTSWLNIFKQSSSNYKYYARGSYTPIKGDIIFFKSESTSRASDHVGLVIGTTDTHIYTVEGNTSGGVYIKSYAFNDTYIVGFAVPKYESDITSSRLSGKYSVTASSSLNMRTGPSTSYDIIKVLRRGQEVEVISFTGTWAKVRVNGTEGFVSGSYIAPIECTQISVTVNKNTKDEYKIYAGYNCSVNLPEESKAGMEFDGFIYAGSEEKTDGKAIVFTESAELVPVFKEIKESDTVTESQTSAPDASSTPDSSSLSDSTTAESGENTDLSVNITVEGCNSFVMGGVSLVGVISLAAVMMAKKKKN